MGRTKAEPYAAEEDLVREIAREVVERVAPHELVLFHAESTAYFRDPRKALKAARKRAAAKPKDERFGFGSGELIDLATPIVLAMVETGLVTVGAHLMLTTVERGAGSLRPFLRRVLRRPDPAEGGGPAGQGGAAAGAEASGAEAAGVEAAGVEAAGAGTADGSADGAADTDDAARAADVARTDGVVATGGVAPADGAAGAVDAAGAVEGSAPPASAPPASAPPAGRAAALPPDVIAAVRQAVYEQALRLGVDEDGSRLLADAVIGALTA
ncbi:hypothetical protein ACFWUQ_23520 [Streptomyces sp. NPDC058662]|uniref:hypothetical protein n=1 Tax=Streptomyces sp. NPDC058662 TaxID=3346583 RepID=UPI003655245C